MKFLLPNKHEIFLEDSVLSHFKQHRQLNDDMKEAGGQLFAEFLVGKTVVKFATGPRFWDTRGKFFYLPQRMMENLEIKTMRKKGLHFVGDWHTHPEVIPRPSLQDIKTISSCYQESEHQLLGFLMVIVGTKEFPAGLSVTFHDDKRWSKLKPVT